MEIYWFEEKKCYATIGEINAYCKKFGHEWFKIPLGDGPECRRCGKCFTDEDTNG